MGCIQGQQQIASAAYYPSPELAKQNSKPNMPSMKNSLPSDASVMRQGDEMRRNFGEMTNMMKLMMNRMQAQDQIIQQLKKEKNSSVPPSKDRELQLDSFENIGKKTISKYSVMCKNCIHLMPKFLDLQPGLSNCQKCGGYGAYLYLKQIDVKCLKCKISGCTFPVNICQKCNGKGVTKK